MSVNGFELASVEKQKTGDNFFEIVISNPMDESDELTFIVKVEKK